MGSCISRGGGGGTMSYTTFGIWGKGDEGEKILKCYTFDLFMLSINIHETVQWFHVFFFHF